MSSDAPYSISDLAGLTGLSVRTIRYYLAQGLIPASGESGPGAHYGAGHLGRLRLVRRLQQQHLPLAEIRARLVALTDAEVAELAGEGTPPTPEPETSALDYVRAVLAGSQTTTSPAPQIPGRAMPAPAARTAAAMPPMRDGPSGEPRQPRLLRRMRSVASELREAAAHPAMPLATAKEPPALAPDAPEEPSATAGTAVPAPQSIERSQWERLSLGPNLELHIRRPLGRLEQKRVERLITIARQVLKEEQP